jgi:hypothetical protein
LGFSFSLADDSVNVSRVGPSGRKPACALGCVVV